MAMWEENKHPRDKSGQFTSKGNEGQGGSDKGRKELAKKLADAGYDINKLKSVKETLADDDFDNDFEEEFLDIDEIVSDNEYVYFGIDDKDHFIDLLNKRDNVPLDKAKEWVEKNWDQLQAYQNEEESEIDYENIEYPKGTSKEYTMVANKKYQDALPILEKAGIKLEDFGEGKETPQGGYEDNSKEIMDKYVFEPFRKKYPSGNNDVWEKEYQPLYDAIDSVLDKRYNDWWIRNHK